MRPTPDTLPALAATFVAGRRNASEGVRHASSLVACRCPRHRASL